MEKFEMVAHLQKIFQMVLERFPDGALEKMLENPSNFEKILHNAIELEFTPSGAAAKREQLQTQLILAGAIVRNIVGTEGHFDGTGNTA